MPKIAIAIIDGTGDFNDGDYSIAMAGSYCNQLHFQNRDNAFYKRGPNLSGYGTETSGEEAANFLSRAFTSDKETRLFLAGYSRGGSAALSAAHYLAEKKIKVAGIFLFDPVNRRYGGGKGIPGNVKYSRTACRDLESSAAKSAIKKYEGTVDSGFGNPMRPGFGRENFNPLTSDSCGIPGVAPVSVSRANVELGRDGGKHHQAYFLASHGAMGGVGWNIQEDLIAQKHVAAWMNAGLSEMGLIAKLRSSPANFAQLPPKRVQNSNERNWSTW